ncbi:MAG: sialidase family protein [Thermoplasmatota archaeon]
MLRLPWRTIGVTIACGFLLVAVLPATATAPVFSSLIVASPEQIAEPSVHVDPTTSPARVYITGPEAGNPIWYSANDGASFTRGATTGGGGGDADVATDGNGVVYVSDLLGAGGASSTLPVSVSLDGGKTFSSMVLLDPTATAIAYDRQWDVAWGNGNVVEIARAGSTEAAWVSTNRAASFSGPYTVATDVNVAGRILRDGSGTLWVPYHNSAGTGLNLAKSTDGGKTWTSSEVAPYPTNITSSGTTSFPLFPSIAADSSGNLYLVATLYGPYGATTYFTRSLDGGVTFSPLVAISSTTPTPIVQNSPSAVMATVTAGSTGRVAVSWYQARDTLGKGELDISPELGNPKTQWDLMVAESTSAANATPTWTITTAYADFHTGSICTGGLTFCPSPSQLGVGNVPQFFDRRVLDFFGTDTDPSGHVMDVIPVDRDMTHCVTGQGTCYVGDLYTQWADLTLVTQTGGTLLR